MQACEVSWVIAEYGCITGFVKIVNNHLIEDNYIAVAPGLT